MKLFDENGEEYEGKAFYDEYGNSLDMGFFEKRKEDISDAFSTSFLLGLILLIISPFWGIAYIILMAIFKIIIFLLKILWWIIKLPFCLIIYKEFPKF